MTNRKLGFSAEELSGTAARILANMKPDYDKFPDHNYDNTAEFADLFGETLERIVKYCVEKRMPFAFMFFPFTARNSKSTAGFHCGASGVFPERGLQLRMLVADKMCKMETEKEMEDFILNMADAVKLKREITEHSETEDAKMRDKINANSDIDTDKAAKDFIDKIMSKK